MSRSVYLHKVLAKVLIAAVLLLSPPAVTAKNVPKATTKSEPKATTPICSIKCPEGYRAALFTWELHPERTGYDETGVEIVPADGVWKVSCAARCELKVEGEPTKVTTEKKEVCDSGGEPGPFTGPWRITGKWVRECAAIYDDGCGLHCYPIKSKKPPPPPKKKPAGKGKKK